MATKKKTVKRTESKALPAVAKKVKTAPQKNEAVTSVGLDVGDVAPPFSLLDQDDKTVSSDSLKGKAYVLYFYPKDDTPGCTKEACAFRDDMKKFDAGKVRVIGVSPDKPASHAKFRAKYDLNFTLLSDVDKTFVNAFGVWVKKQNYGRDYMGVERSTFLVGKDGKIKKAWRRVKVDGHSTAVLGALKEGA